MSKRQRRDRAPSETVWLRHHQGGNCGEVALATGVDCPFCASASTVARARKLVVRFCCEYGECPRAQQPGMRFCYGHTAAIERVSS